MSNNIDRLTARSDIRAFGAQAAAQSTQEYAMSYQRRLNDEAGTVMKLKTESPLDAKRDEAGFAELRSMAGQL